MDKTKHVEANDASSDANAATEARSGRIKVNAPRKALSVREACARYGARARSQTKIKRPDAAKLQGGIMS